MLRGDEPELIDHAAARRNARRIVLIAIGLMVVAVAVGVTAAVLSPSHDDDHHSRSLGGVIVAAGFVLLFMVVAVALLVRMYRRPNFARLLQYDWGRRQRVGKALRRGRPIAAEDRPVADALVRTMRRQRWFPYLFGALVLLNLARALLNHGFQRDLAIGAVVAYALLAPWVIWQRRAMFANYEKLIATDPPGTPPA